MVLSGEVITRAFSAVMMLFVPGTLCTAARGENAPITLPAWFEENRVQAHGEHNLQLALRLTPERHASAIRALGAEVLTRIFLNRDEGAWWPSRVGEISPLIGDRDFAREIVEAVHGQGMKVIAYHRHMSDAAMQHQHPDWVCLNPDGSPVMEPRGKDPGVHVLCLNSPYREYIKTRLVELADRGVDVIYFDSWHMPEVCTCEFCRKAFRKEAGTELDPSAPEGSRRYMEAVDFVNRSMVRAFSEWHEAVRERHPEVFFAISSSRYPLFTYPHIDSDLLAISDTSKTEFDKAFGGSIKVMAREADFAAPAFDDQVALGWSVVRDASGGRPPLMWVPHIRSERAALYSAGAAVTYGCIASMSVTIRNHPDQEAERAERLFRSTFDFGRKVSSSLAYGRPLPWAMLHIGEGVRNTRYPDQPRMWREVFCPAIGAFEALKQSHVPWTTVTDRQLAKGVDAATQLLILPWPDELDDAQRVAVESFERRGGTVLRLDWKAGWHLKRARPLLVNETAQQIGKASGAAPIRVDGPKRMHAVMYHRPDAKQYVVCLMNGWGWFRSTRLPDPELNEGTEPDVCQDVEITLVSSAGRPGRVVEVVSGQPLRVDEVGGRIRVALPAFQIMACVAIDY